MENTENYGLEELQSSLLEALLAFDRICREHRINYSLHGGTLLGAERNHKYIPWDDDIDVSMTRAEYEKFQRAAQKLPEGFELDKETIWFPRLVMRRNQGAVYVDILIWDYISSNRLSQKVKITLLRFFQGMMKTHIEYERFGVFNKLLLFITHVVGLVVPQRIKLKQFNHLCEFCFLGDRRYIHRSNDSFAGVAYIFDTGYMEGYMEIEFEHHQFMVNKRYHEFLERNYGPDYLEPPPPEKRMSGHEKFRKDL